MTQVIGDPSARPTYLRAAFVRTRLLGAALVILLHAALLLILTRLPESRHAPHDFWRGVVPMTIYNLHVSASLSPHPQKDALLPSKQSPSPPEPDNRPAKPNLVALEPNPAPQLVAPSLDGIPEPVMDDTSPTPALAAPSLMLAGDDKCDLVPTLKTALEADDGVTAALVLIPVKARSVANAIMLWNGKWVDPTSLGGALAIDPIRAALVEAIQKAPSACVLENLHGPRLIAITDRRGTAVLAIGSGEWHWKDLMYATAHVIP